MHRRSALCTLGCHPLPTLLRPWANFRHRRTASFILDVFANCAFKVRWAVFDAQAQYFVHSGLPLTSNPSPTAGHFSCTGAVLHSAWVFLLTVHFTFAGLFLMHRRSTSCILGCHSFPILLRPLAILYALALRFVDVQEHRFEDILALAPEMSRSIDLKTFWHWLQKSTK